MGFRTLLSFPLKLYIELKVRMLNIEYILMVYFAYDM